MNENVSPKGGVLGRKLSRIVCFFDSLEFVLRNKASFRAPSCIVDVWVVKANGQIILALRVLVRYEIGAFGSSPVTLLPFWSFRVRAQADAELERLFIPLKNKLSLRLVHYDLVGKGGRELNSTRQRDGEKAQ